MAAPVEAGLDPLADWIAGLRLDALPAEVLHAGKRSLLDTVGVAIAGAERPVVGKAAASLESLGEGPCSVLPLGAAPRPGPTAALINGAAAHALDFDDTVFEGILHGSAAVWPAAQAACELLGAPGDRLLLAFIAGLEAAYALGALIGNEAYRDGWWASSLLGLFGATAGAAKALDLGPQETGHALHLAAAQSFGLRGIFGSEAKPYVLGRAAQAGLELALAARAGLGASAASFEGAAGFLQVINRGRPTRPVFARLGAPFRLVEPGVAFKLYPVCSAAQAGVEATLGLMEEHGLEAGQVERAELRATPLVCLQLVHDRPQSILEGQFSMPFAVGCALAYGALGSAQLDDRLLCDPALRHAMAKVTLSADEALLARVEDPVSAPEAAEVTLHLRDGRSFSRLNPMASGMPAKPLTDAALDAKFLSNTTPCMGEASAQALLERLRAIESADSAAPWAVGVRPR